MKRIATITIGTLVAFLATPGAIADEPPALAHNPFARPPSERLAVARGPTAATDDVVTEIDLRATMASDSSALANVNGRVIRPGDEVDGYLLLEVLEDRAVFQRGDKRLTVYVKPDLVEDDDQDES